MSTEPFDYPREPGQVKAGIVVLPEDGLGELAVERATPIGFERKAGTQVRR